VRPAVLRRLLADPRSAAGCTLLGFVVLAAVLGPLLWPPSAERPDFAAVLDAPSLAHPLGTDDLGRDVLARVLRGGRVSLLVALGSVAGACALGTPIGLVCGVLGGWTDRVLMRCMDVLLAFPGILLALGVTAALGASAVNAALAIAAVNLPVFARLARAQARIVAAMDYVEAARATGLGTVGILRRHVAPNALAPVLVQATLLLASSILTESYLSFLGLGVQPPTPTWGNMLRDATGFLDQSVWLACFPGAAIFATVLGFNLLGDGLRDRLDPRDATSL
jgi:peptide/nickel transport system permease protein